MQQKYLVFTVFLFLIIIIVGSVMFVYTPTKRNMDSMQQRDERDRAQPIQENVQSTEVEESTYSYSELQNMAEISLQDGKILIVLYENQAIPYRWCQEVKGENVLLRNQDTVDGTGSFNEVGDSPSYHVYEYEMIADGEAEIMLRLSRMDDDNQVLEQRRYLLNRNQGTVTYEEILSEE